MSSTTTEARVYTEYDNCRVREDICPAGMVEVDVYTPCHSTTPWDYHGMRHQREYNRVLRAAGIPTILLETRRRILRPVGTGPGGAVRLGDDMTPHTYRIAVFAYDKGRAENAIAAHRQAIQDWLHNGGEFPQACRD